MSFLGGEALRMSFLGGEALRMSLGLVTEELPALLGGPWEGGEEDAEAIAAGCGGGGVV